MSDSSVQAEFDFKASRTKPDGLAAWRRIREQQLFALARANGLPLGKHCRVELGGNVILEGMLQLAEDALPICEPARNLKMRLQIGRCQFTPREIVSVVRLD